MRAPILLRWWCMVRHPLRQRAYGGLCLRCRAWHYGAGRVR